MRITLQSGEFAKAIAWGTKGMSELIAGSSNGEEIAVLEADGNNFSVKTYDGAKFFMKKITGSGMAPDESFMVNVLGVHLKNLMSALDKDSTVSVEVVDSEVVFDTPTGQYRIDKSLKRFPAFPEVPPRVGTISYADIASSANKNATSCAPPDMAGGMISITGVTFEFFGASAQPFIRLVSTNRMTFLKKEIEYIPDSTFELPNVKMNGDTEEAVFSVCVKKDAVQVLFGSRDAFDGDIDIHSDGTYFGISDGNSYGFVNTLNTTTFPYERVLAEKAGVNFQSVLVDRKEITNALSKVHAFSKVEDVSYLRFAFTSESVTISTDEKKGNVRIPIMQATFLDNPEFNGDNGEFVFVENDLAKNNSYPNNIPDSFGIQEIAFDPTYLLPVVKNATSQAIEIRFATSGMAPVYVYDSDKNTADRDDSYTSIVMPRQ